VAGGGGGAGVTLLRRRDSIGVFGVLKSFRLVIGVFRVPFLRYKAYIGIKSLRKEVLRYFGVYFSVFRLF